MFALYWCDIVQRMSIQEKTKNKALENMTTAVLILNSTHEIEYINTAAETLLGFSSRRVKGAHIKKLLVGASQFCWAMERAQALEAGCMERGVEMGLTSTKTIKVDCIITPIDTHEAESGLLVELIDVEHFQRLMRDERQEQMMNATKESMRGMAHEIKNPLGGIRGAAQLLEMELSDEGLKEYTQIIIKEADRLWRFTDKTLAASHKAEVEEINVHEVLEYVFTVISAEKHGTINVIRDYDPSIPAVMIDREQLIQAVMNLLGNAIEAVDKNSGEIIIETRVLRHYSIQHKLHALVASIAIIDNGPGVPEELKETLFYPMITGKAEGTGLGLSIAQQLTQNHGGLIEYERRNDKTCFHLYLPIGRAHAN